MNGTTKGIAPPLTMKELRWVLLRFIKTITHRDPKNDLLWLTKLDIKDGY